MAGPGTPRPLDHLPLPLPAAGACHHRWQYPTRSGDTDVRRDRRQPRRRARGSSRSGGAVLSPAPTPTSLVPCDFVNPQPKPAEPAAPCPARVGAPASKGPGSTARARDLLRRSPPRFGTRQPLRRAGEAAEGAARRLVTAIDESYLAVQGPPGSGKSTVGARMIVDLVAGGWRVGVTANSHKVIGALLEKVARVEEERGVAVRIGQRAGQEPHLRRRCTPGEQRCGAALVGGGCCRRRRWGRRGSGRERT